MGWAVSECLGIVSCNCALVGRNLFRGVAWTLWNRRTAGQLVNWPRRRLTPKPCWLLIVSWLILGANNIWRIPPDFGFDLREHYEYVQHITHSRSLPLATEGWQMFQPPLFYLLALPWYAVLTPHFSDDIVIKVLRFLPLLCGLAQIEIVYRASRAVFPKKK